MSDRRNEESLNDSFTVSNIRLNCTSTVSISHHCARMIDTTNICIVFVFGATLFFLISKCYHLCESHERETLTDTSTETLIDTPTEAVGDSSVGGVVNKNVEDSEQEAPYYASLNA
jgi:hypothetical protein